MSFTRTELTARFARSVSKVDLVVLFAVLLMAVVLRVAWVMHSEAAPHEGVDSYWYDSVAKSVALGRGIANPLDGVRPTALFPPGYALVLGGGYKIFGAHLWVAQALNIVIAVATIAITYAIARVVLGRLAAGIAAGLLAVFPSQVIYSSVVMSELLFGLLVVAVIGLLLLASRASSHLVGQTGAASLLLMLAAGVLVGAASLVRGQGVILLAVVPIWWLLLRRPRGQFLPVIVFLYATIFTVLPWTIRNWHQLDSPVLISSTMGWNAVIGHNEAADGGWMDPSRFFVSTLKYQNPQGEAEKNNRGVRLAWDYARTHPVREIELSVSKAHRLWKTDGDAVRWQTAEGRPVLGDTERRLLTDLSNYFYFSVLGLALVGLSFPEARSHGWRSLFVLLALGWTVFHIVFFAQDRFHYPLSPLLSLAAAAGALVALGFLSRLGSSLSRHIAALRAPPAARS